ncbi:hypothetical protein TYRP_003199 [Tyrophagus putrescentiae]|nr:hypothetical protein TYRP_003199 [Tyrophagus putrescentiae]
MKLNTLYRRQLIWPFWDSWYNLQEYLNSVTLIRLEKNKARRRRLTFQQTLIIFSLLTVRCLELLYISFAELTTDFWRHLFHDYSFYLYSPRAVNFLAFLFAVQSLVFIFKMHFFDVDSRHFETLHIVQQILFNPYKKSSLFLTNRVKTKQQKMVFISDQIRKLTSMYLRAPIYLYIVTFFTLLYFNFQLLKYISQHLDYFGLLNFSSAGLASLTFALFNAYLSNYAFICFALINITLSVIIFTFSLFASFHSQTLVLVTAGNGYFGSLLMTFFLIYMPNNAYMSVQLIGGKYPLISGFIIGNAHAFEYVAAFGFHALCSVYSSRLHRCSKLLLHWQVNGAARLRSLPVRLKLAHYIENY